MAAVNPVNPLSYAGSQAYRRHNIEVLHRAGKSPQEITQQTGHKNQVESLLACMVSMW